MRIDMQALHAGFQETQRGRKSRHSVRDRTRPSMFQYDYLTLQNLSSDIQTLIAAIPTRFGARRALDLGSDKCPYRDLLVEHDFTVKCLDVNLAGGADYAGHAEQTDLPDGSFELVLCTQVLEHCQNPWHAMQEIHRILAPGGYLIFSVPHVWFYHPHPNDHWRFTQEGVVRLCEMGGFAPSMLLSQGGTLLTVGQILNFMVYGAMGRWGAPAYLILNGIARAADKCWRNDLLCNNFACLAQRI